MYFVLPYPPAILSPNSREHWAPKNTAKSKYKGQCKAIASQYKPMKAFSVEFYPPNKRRRDIDNAIASMKAGFDGLSLAWGIDDSEFLITFPRKFKEPVKFGKVVIHGT